MDQVVADSVADPRFYTVILATFAGLALLLAAAGIYGVMSYSVNRRQHEIGIRMALGAKTSNILGQFMIEGVLYVFIGMALGTGGALYATRLLSSILFEVQPTDPPTFLGSFLVLMVFALAAVYFPARKATKVDPLLSLRHE